MCRFCVRACCGPLDRHRVECGLHFRRQPKTSADIAVKVFKRLLLALIAGGALAAIGWVAWLYVEYPNVPDPVALRVPASPQKVARGAYLFNNVARCVDCHSTRDWSKYAAPIIPGTEGKGGEAFTHALMGVPGEFYARNITPTALANWTDGEIARAITTGVNKHGEALFPVMPYRNYGELDPEDVNALVAYIRTLKPQPDQVPDRSFHFPMQFMVRTLPRPARLSERPDPSDRVSYGGYLARTAGCTECHATRDETGAPRARDGVCRRYGVPLSRGRACPSAQHHARCRHGHRHVERGPVRDAVQDLGESPGPRTAREPTVGQYGHALEAVGWDDARRSECDLRLPARSEARDPSRSEAR